MTASTVTAAEVISEIGCSLEDRAMFIGGRVGANLLSIKLWTVGDREVRAQTPDTWIGRVWGFHCGETLDSQIVPIETAYIAKLDDRTYSLTW